MILSNHCGQRCQVDLIDMSSQVDPNTGNKWILRYVDHMSGYGYVRCLPNKESKTVGAALVQIISESIKPTILQSDNGSEFLGYCLQYLKKYFPNIHIVKRRSQHPQSQGMVERSHQPFKDALQDWMQDTNNDNWSIGAYIVQSSMNRRTHKAHGDTIPYETYYGCSIEQSIDSVLGTNAEHVKTEVGLNFINDLLGHLKKYYPNILLSDEDLKEVMKKVDDIYFGEEVLETNEEKDAYDVEFKMRILFADVLSQLIGKHRLENFSSLVSNKNNDDNEDEEENELEDKKPHAKNTVTEVQMDSTNIEHYKTPNISNKSGILDSDDDDDENKKPNSDTKRTLLPSDEIQANRIAERENNRVLATSEHKKNKLSR